MGRPIITIDFDALKEAADKARSFLDDILAPLPVPEYPGDSREWEKPSETPLPPLIGFGGLKEHGKDAAADMLVHLRGYKKTFMSEPLTAAVSLIGPRGPWVRLDFDVFDGLDIHSRGGFMRYADLVEAVGYTQAKKHRDAREYLQGLGTEVGRKMLGETVWVDIAEKKISEARAAGQPVVITGIRYENELELIHRLGGTTVWVERTSWPEKASHPLTEAIDEALEQEPVEDTTATHSSETSLTAEDFDVVLENDATLKHLQVKVLDLHTELANRG